MNIQRKFAVFMCFEGRAVISQLCPFLLAFRFILLKLRTKVESDYNGEYRHKGVIRDHFDNTQVAEYSRQRYGDDALNREQFG